MERKQRSKVVRLDQSFASFFQDLINKESCRDQFVQSITSTGFTYCLLEFPELVAAGLGQGKDDDSCSKAEYTIVETHRFHPASWNSFADKLKSEVNGKKTVTSFMNLSGDAVLVVPVPTNIDSVDRHSGHLMDFFKNGLKEQIHAAIKETSALVVSESQRRSKAGSLLYLSTHGHGVPWLHFRVCTQPKYFVSRQYM